MHKNNAGVLSGATVVALALMAAWAVLPSTARTRDDQQYLTDKLTWLLTHQLWEGPGNLLHGTQRLTTVQWSAHTCDVSMLC